jgi:hypothetical protein
MKLDEKKLGQGFIDLFNVLNIEITDEIAIKVGEFTKKLFNDEFNKDKKPKTQKVIKHTYLGRITLNSEEELNEFLENKEEWLSGCEMPSFSFNKGESPDAVEGEELFLRINDDLYSFTIHEGDCVEASWSGSIYQTDVKNVKLIPNEELENYNLVRIKGWQYGYDY